MGVTFFCTVFALSFPPSPQPSPRGNGSLLAHPLPQVVLTARLSPIDSVCDRETRVRFLPSASRDCAARRGQDSGLRSASRSAVAENKRRPTIHSSPLRADARAIHLTSL